MPTLCAVATPSRPMVESVSRIDDIERVGDDDCAGVEASVIVRTQTEHVRWNIGPVVRSAERSDVCTLCVRARRSVNAHPANLAAVSMLFLHPLHHGGTPQHALRRDRYTTRNCNT